VVFRVRRWPGIAGFIGTTCASLKFKRCCHASHVHHSTSCATDSDRLCDMVSGLDRRVVLCTRRRTRRAREQARILRQRTVGHRERSNESPDSLAPARDTSESCICAGWRRAPAPSSRGAFKLFAALAVRSVITTHRSSSPKPSTRKLAASSVYCFGMVWYGRESRSLSTALRRQGMECRRCQSLGWQKQPERLSLADGDGTSDSWSRALDANRAATSVCAFSREPPSTIAVSRLPCHTIALPPLQPQR